MTSTAQQFVDALNHKYMPQLGYIFFRGKWWWPLYDWENQDDKDFKKKFHIKNQQKRLMRGYYRSPDNKQHIYLLLDKNQHPHDEIDKDFYPSEHNIDGLPPSRQ